MIALLDVNVLLALFDPAHVHHDAAHVWFTAHRAERWATCPITENGFTRVLSNPAYPGRRTTVGDAVARLRELTRADDHSFWPDSVSLLDDDVVDPTFMGGHRDVTDAYLLSLAAANGGRLVTFDRSIPTKAVAAAALDHLVVLGSPGA